MNINHLTLFLRIAATQNISQAGAEMGLSAAVASNHINKLEEQLGVRLLHRTTRKVALTQEGRAFVPHAEDVLASIDAAKAAVGAGASSPSGTLRIAAPASFGRMHLVPALRQFMKNYPNLKLDLKLSDTIVDLVEGGFDVAIRNSPLQDSSLIAKKLCDDRRILCASPMYITQHGAPESPEALKNHNCITLMNLEDWTFKQRVKLEQSMNSKQDEKTIKIKASGNFRTDNGEAVRDACISGLGITVNSSWSAYQHLLSGELVEILSEFPLHWNSAVWAVYPSSRQLAPKVRAFIDYFSDYFGGIPYWDALLERKANKVAKKIV